MFSLEYADIRENPDTNGNEQNPTFGMTRSRVLHIELLDKYMETRKGERKLKT
jgi:hypothetical protein